MELYTNDHGQRELRPATEAEMRAIAHSFHNLHNAVKANNYSLTGGWLNRLFNKSIIGKLDTDSSYAFSINATNIPLISGANQGQIALEDSYTVKGERNLAYLRDGARLCLERKMQDDAYVNGAPKSHYMVREAIEIYGSEYAPALRELVAIPEA